MRARTRRRGFAMVEFTFIAIPMIFLTVAIAEASIAMWQYHSMVNAVAIATRFAVTHGRGCTQNGNSCAITLGTLTSLLSAQAPALDPAKLNVTLYTKNTTTTCNPINTCFSNSATFPNATDNAVNFDVKIVATYSVANPLPLFWPGSAPTAGSAFTLGATSRQRIVF
jgi:Flp pilus assembly protein TadG